ncbi:MAG: hypothetical protein IJP80_03180 [Bacteroidales bacterium]|nr:hypothetical protein [Bacteroidales bacterium]
MTRILSLTVTLLLVLSSCSNAQQQRRVGKPYQVVDSLLYVPIDSSYSFINYDSNQLIIFGDSTQMRRFSAKWHRVLSSGEGNVVIMQIGASHVQGGTFPHQIRRNLLLGARRSLQGSEVEGTFPFASRGFVFPYSAAVKCNNPFDYKVSRSHPLALTRNVYKEPLERLGLPGIAVTAADSVAEIGLTLTDSDLAFATNKVTLLGDSRGGVVPCIAPGESDSLLLPDSVNLALRRYHYHLPSAVDSLRVIIPCDSGESFALTGVLFENHLPGITYHSIGVNGASVSDYLTKCPYFTADLRLAKPDLVIFGIGINDAAGPNYDSAVFRQRYLQLVDSVRSVSPDCAFIFITNNDSYRRVKRKYNVNHNGPLVREAFMRIAAESGGMVWDQFSIMGGLNSMKLWTGNDLGQRDRIHFTRRGYQLLGNLFSNAFFHALEQTRPAKQPPSPQQTVPSDTQAIKQSDTQAIKQSDTQAIRKTPRVYQKPADRKKSNSDNEGLIYISY